MRHAFLKLFDHSQCIQQPCWYREQSMGPDSHRLNITNFIVLWYSQCVMKQLKDVVLCWPLNLKIFSSFISSFSLLDALLLFAGWFTFIIGSACFLIDDSRPINMLFLWQLCTELYWFTEAFIFWMVLRMAPDWHSIKYLFIYSYTGQLISIFERDGFCITFGHL